jgi:putative membrane protein
MGTVHAPPAPEWPAVLARWHFEPAAAAVMVGVAWLYFRGRTMAGASPRQTRLFTAGLGVVAIALVSPVATYAEALLSVHMVQHLLLALVGAPLLVAARPLPALLAVLPSSLRQRARAVGASRLGRLVRHPVVAWLAFAVTGWAVHFSPLFDLALEHPPVHGLEHALFLGSGLLFWAPVLGETSLSHPLRLVYVALAMPQNTFLAVAISSAGEPLYEAYGRLGRTWGPSLLADQRQAGGLMWVAGDVTLLVAVLAVAAAWAAADMTRELDEGGASSTRPPSR